MRKFWQNLIQYFGVTSMLFAVFLYTDYHDFTLTIAGVLGMIALIGTVRALYVNNSYPHLWIGYLCLLIILTSVYMYYANIFVYYLPAFQKISMLIIITWTIRLNFIFIKSYKDFKEDIEPIEDSLVRKENN